MNAEKNMERIPEIEVMEASNLWWKITLGRAYQKVETPTAKAIIPTNA
jgi:hypothetical protein